MEVSTVIIKRVTIFSFKNIRNLTFDLANGENLVIEGKNGLGKSNILNAIYWCLTGYDLNGSSDNELFVTRGQEDKGIVDVEVTTNVGKFGRKCQRDVKGTLASTLFIDDFQCDTLQEGEIEIDKRLGILPFTFSNLINKDFNLRRFLLNPSYLFGLTPKAIRDVLAKQVSRNVKNVEFNPLFIDLLSKNDINVDEITNYYEPIEKLAAKFEADKKVLKSEKDKLVVVSDYLKENTTEDDKLWANLDFKLQEVTDSINKVDENLLVLDSGRQSLNEAMEKVQKGSLKIQFQTTTAKGTKKNAFDVKSCGITLDQRSTSESVIDSFVLVDTWRYAVGCDVSLPIFIDRAESMNADKIQALTFGHQVLYTKVTTNRKIKINDAEVQ